MKSSIKIWAVLMSYGATSKRSYRLPPNARRGKRGENDHNEKLVTVWKYYLTGAVALDRGMQLVHDYLSGRVLGK